MRNSPIRFRFLALAGIALLSACAAHAPVAERHAPEKPAAVRVLTQPDAWPGDIRVAKAVTPILVRIENDGEVPIDVRYGALTLLAPDGDRYEAVPPWYVDKVSGQAGVKLNDKPVLDPAFHATGFEIAPYFAAAYPGADVHEGIFAFDPFFYDAYNYWQGTSLPTREMREQALPEGVLQPGGRLEGWVYFRKVPAKDVAKEGVKSGRSRIGSGVAMRD